jgi:hypothetical protein
MTVDEAIEELQDIQKQYGDVEFVSCYEENGHLAINFDWALEMVNIPHQGGESQVCALKKTGEGTTKLKLV